MSILYSDDCPYFGFASVSRPYSADVVEGQLRGILADEKAAAVAAVGALTTLDRPTWAAERAAMEKNKTNAYVARVC